jgi:hypothetical protein
MPTSSEPRGKTRKMLRAASREIDRLGTGWVGVSHAKDLSQVIMVKFVRAQGSLLSRYPQTYLKVT